MITNFEAAVTQKGSANVFVYQSVKHNKYIV